MSGIIGKKIGMTSIFDADGKAIPCTVIEAGPCVVTQVKTVETDGYNAMQLAFAEKKEKHTTSALKGHFAKAKTTPKRKLVEFKHFPELLNAGDVVKVDVFAEGDFVEVVGTSKGKGFQGVMKRHHFKGGRDSHGCSLSHRVPGSIGQRTYPGRVIPGKKMPGHMGDRTVTTKNLEVVGIKEEQGILLIKGAVPGANHAQVCIFPHSKDFESRVLSSQGGKNEQVEAAPAA